MKVRYYSSTDTMAIELSTAQVVDSELIAPNVVLSYDKDNAVVKIEFTGKVSEEFAELLNAASHGVTASRRTA